MRHRGPDQCLASRKHISQVPNAKRWWPSFDPTISKLDELIDSPLGTKWLDLVAGEEDSKEMKADAKKSQASGGAED